MSQVSFGLTLVNLLQLLTIPGWGGEGVAMPFPDFVGVPPMIPMHAYVPGCRPRHSRPPTPAFHLTKSSVGIGPLKKATTSHVSPGLTMTNLLQLLTMPGCVGTGVAMPLLPFVGDG